MMVEVIIFLSNLPHISPLYRNMNIGRPQDLELEKGRYQLPAVFLVETGNFANLKRFTDVVTDRGVKNKKKGLADYLTELDGDKIPLIDGNYASAGRLQQGIRALLKQAVGKKEKKLYIIGANGPVFKTIWKKGGRNSGDTRTGFESAFDDSLQKPQISEINHWLVNELGKCCQVPDELKERYLGNSEDALLVRIMIMLAAKNLSPVLILGNTGSGKEIVARQIHQNSERSGGPFIPVNCGAIPETMIESELFGYKKGAFTGAIKDKPGLWKAANNGTLFLDEIGDLSRANQVKILRAMTSGQIRPLGSTKEDKVDARIIAATNRELFAMIQTGEFRRDLYYRLGSFFIRTPSLKNNPDDIPKIAQILWGRITKRKSEPLSSEILAEFKKHSWPGNVRELKMVLQALNNLFLGKKIGAEHLKGLFYIEGRLAQSDDDEPVSEKDLILEKAKCLRHLRRAHEIIHACHNAVEGLVNRLKTNNIDNGSGQVNLKIRYHELLRFCDRGPAVFPSEETFVAVGTIKNKMTWLITRLQEDPRNVINFWEVDLKSAFDYVQMVLFKGVERLISAS